MRCLKAGRGIIRACCREFATRDQARNEITEYIEIFYNPQRTQTRPDYPSPAAFAQQFNLSKTAA
jgi:putative transposase